ncbi:MAG: phosphoribosylformylglycinamidine synthase subunit PurL [Candidatus Bathyarchaeia archaeon]
MNLTKVDDRGLERISREYMLSLNILEMKAIQKYFQTKGRDPTDVELNTIAQTWSEHCIHKTFKGIIEYNGEIINGLLKTFIIEATRKLAKPWCISVFEDNAGIITFDKDFNIAFKVETHNHPTALDPYGGAGTGSGGVFRDILGVGAKPILSTDVLFFGALALPYSSLPRGVMHPKRLMRGSVAGIRDYGNRMGIPTANGGIWFSEGYIRNPLVYAGCLGFMPNNKYVRMPCTGDVIVLVGGRTGRDGIHGVTFASIELTEDSETLYSGAVQIGNPIVEKKVLDGLMRARDEREKPLYSAVTDCGGGGLSSAIGEMGKNIGASVRLEKVPLKYAGLKPWEIWVSESQERMILSVPKRNVKELIDIFNGEDCEATVIGEFTGSKRLVVSHAGDKVCDLEMSFLHEGVPQVVRKAFWRLPEIVEPSLPDKDDYTGDLKRLLSHPNIASKEWVIRQYDHEVQARTVVKPLVGIGSGPSDACVLKPLYNSWRGVVVSNGVNPFYSSNPYDMACSAIDEAVRNNICCGGRRIALLDNFSWGNPEKPDQLGQLVEAVRGCHDAAKGFGTPFISGKDSLYNEYVEGGVTVSIPPTLVISAVGIIPDIRKAVTMDVKNHGDFIYIVGETRSEMGGSHHYLINGVRGGATPKVDVQSARKAYAKITKAIDSGLIKACHDCSEGGIGVAAAEMALAGDLGVILTLDKVPGPPTPRNEVLLFSESNSRLIVEVAPKDAERFEALLVGVPYSRIGEVASENEFIVLGLEGKTIIKEDVAELRSVWKSTFNWWAHNG